MQIVNERVHSYDPGEINMRAANLTICLLCAAVMLVIIAGTYSINTEDNRTSAVTVKILKCIFLFNISSFLVILAEGEGRLIQGLPLTVMWLSFFSSLYYFAKYVYTYTGQDEQSVRKDLIRNNVICLIGFASIMVFGFFPESFRFADLLGGISILCGLSLPLLSTAAVIQARSKLNRENMLSFSTYISVGFASLLLQIFFPQIRLMNVGLTISAMFIYVVLSVRRYLELSEQKQVLSETRMKMLQMQMNPHFLSNTMNTIYHLCEKDPKQAMQGIDDLSGFMRNNLDLSAAEELFPFEKELESIRYYYSLEQMRRAGKLSIIYMIETTDFLVPPFSIQVFAENAVVHGFNENEGETISFTVRKTPGFIEISILDNGSGFDPPETWEEEKPGHYGITNAAERLKSLLNAEVTITGERGMGTVVHIRIPDRTAGGNDENTDSGR